MDPFPSDALRNVPVANGCISIITTENVPMNIGEGGSEDDEYEDEQ